MLSSPGSGYHLIEERFLKTGAIKKAALLSTELLGILQIINASLHYIYKLFDYCGSTTVLASNIAAD